MNMWLAYLVCGLVIPLEPIDDSDYEYRNNNTNTKIFVGLFLIIVGLYMLSNLLFPHLSIALYKLIKFWPILLVVLGIYIIIKKD